MRKQSAATLALIILLILGGCGCGHKQGFKVAIQQNGEAKIEAFVGYPVRLMNNEGEDVTVNVVRWKYSDGNKDIRPSEGGRLVVAYCEIENNSKDLVVLDMGEEDEWIDVYEMSKDYRSMVAGPTLSLDPEAYRSTPPEICDFEQPQLDLSEGIQPGHTAKGNVIFEVSDDIAFFALEFQIRGFYMLRIKSGDPRPGEGG
ncbi:MAG: hypothetical protein L6427_11360 [Actinomycetia bacterium]|nr:hypothetical protein [Actinomycetes bacterium]